MEDSKKKEVAKKRIGYKRPPYGKKTHVLNRMAPALEYLMESGIPISEVAGRMDLTRQCVNQRLNADDSSLSFMEKLADAIDCDFEWRFKHRSKAKTRKK